MNNSDIPPQDVLQHPLFKEHASCSLGVPYHNAECEDIVLYSKMEMLRGQSRVLPEEYAVPAADGTAANGTAAGSSDSSTDASDDDNDDSVPQSWVRCKPLQAYVEKTKTVERSSAGFSCNGSTTGVCDRSGISATTSSGAADGHTTAFASNGGPVEAARRVGGPGSSSGRVCRGGVCALATRLASSMNLDSEGADAAVVISGADPGARKAAGPAAVGAQL